MPGPVTEAGLIHARRRLFDLSLHNRSGSSGGRRVHPQSFGWYAVQNYSGADGRQSRVTLLGSLWVTLDLDSTLRRFDGTIGLAED